MTDNTCHYIQEDTLSQTFGAEGLIFFEVHTFVTRHFTAAIAEKNLFNFCGKTIEGDFLILLIDLNLLTSVPLNLQLNNIHT